MKALVLIAACGNSAPAPPAPAPVATVISVDAGADSGVVTLQAIGGEQDPPHQPGRIALETSTTQVDTSLSADTVMAKIHSAYIGGVQKCYRDRLKTDPTLAGKETLVFGVNEVGRTVNPSATGIAGIDTCITTAMTKWRFAVPKANDQPTTTSFQIVLRFTPD
ncbi:MAG: AgmX/PglI C-terminal domain-containing protein [Kofleriaceae bacterium]